MAEGIGIDIGGVLAEHATLNGVWRPGGHLAVPEIDGAFDAVRRLREERFGDNTYVVSMCNETVEAYSRQWLEHNKFFDRTGMNPEQLVYCRQFIDKASIAQRLGLDHFVDDRLEVLGHFTSAERLFLFCPSERECAKFATHLGKVSIVNSWQEILDVTLNSSPVV